MDHIVFGPFDNRDGRFYEDDDVEKAELEMLRERAKIQDFALEHGIELTPEQIGWNLADHVTINGALAWLWFSWHGIEWNDSR